MARKPIDFARQAQREAWLAHPTLGEASFANIVRRPHNPIYRGQLPREWAVNGFLFQDPVSQAWFAYIGEYPEHYAMGEVSSRCWILRSDNFGASWEPVGPAFCEDRPLRFEKDPTPIGHYPDVSVVYHDGRYHMVLDWCHAGFDWDLEKADSGTAYAWAAQPEGPFTLAPQPIVRNHELQPLAGKYGRMYASTLIRRKDDWLVLSINDSVSTNGAFAWSLCGMTAAEPAGPYSAPQLLLSPETNSYFPPIVEHFPAFTHDGWIYAPATSVALNRNFQCVFRAPIEAADCPDNWELHQHGSIWHGTSLEAEEKGIWGQTFSGFVDDNQRLQLLYPSLDSHGRGTIHLAARPWEKPYREAGFWLTGHRGPSFTAVRQGYKLASLDAALELGQGSVAVVLGMQGPIGPDKPTSDSSLHSHMLRDCFELVLSESRWQLQAVDSQGNRQRVTAGEHTGQSSSGLLTLQLAFSSHQWHIDINGETWAAPLRRPQGLTGLWAAANSSALVKEFVLRGEPYDSGLHWLYTEALLGAGVNPKDWETMHDSGFRFGLGARSRKNNARVKWNIHGRAMELWSPRSPDLGRCQVYLDGQSLGPLDLYSPERQPSAVVLSRQGLPDTFHALVLESLEGPLVVDSLTVY